MKCNKCEKRKKEQKKTLKALTKTVYLLLMAFVAVGAVVNAGFWFVNLQGGTFPLYKGQQAFMALWGVFISVYLGAAYVLAAKGEHK